MTSKWEFSGVKLNPEVEIRSGSWFVRNERANIEGSVRVFYVQGPRNLQCEILDVQLNNGDRWIMAGENFCGPKWMYGQLKDRLRMTIQIRGDNQTFDLTIPTPGRRTPEAFTASKASSEDIEQIHPDFFKTLESEFSVTVGSREELYEDQSSRRRYLSVIMSEHECMSPIISFLVTRILALVQIHEEMISDGSLKEDQVNYQSALTSLEEETETNKLISSGETGKVEFKSSVWYEYSKAEDISYRPKKKEGFMQDNIIKAVAGLLNSFGGTLFIGVDDDGKPLGLENDFQFTMKKDLDSFENELNQVLSNAFGKTTAAIRTKVSFPFYRGLTICRIDVAQASSFVLVKTSKDDEARYIRHGNKTIPISSIASMLEYRDNHQWNNDGAQ